MLEGDGTNTADIAIHARVTVRGDELEIDLGDCGPQQAGNVNCPRAVARQRVPVRGAGRDRARRSRLGRRPAADLDPHARGHGRARAARGRRGGRQCRDLVPHRRRRPVRARPRGRGAGAGPGHHEQRHARHPCLDVLRDDRRRAGRMPDRARPVGRARLDVEHAQHADRGARARLPAARRGVRAAPRQRRSGQAPRRRRRRAQPGRPRGLPARGDRRAPAGRSRGRGRRRAGPGRPHAPERSRARGQGIGPARPPEMSCRIETPGGGGYGTSDERQAPASNEESSAPS